MISYHVRSRDLVTVVTEIRAKRLITSPYFQRNLVWREIHRQDFIKTLLKGFPIPQIFVAKGQLDIDSMQATECVVDGQQRLGAITGFIDGEFAVDGRRYSDLTSDEKTSFLKYEIPVIDLELQYDDPRLKDVFQVLNRNANSLTAIEKLASLYAPSEFMLFANHLSGDLIYPNAEGEEEEEYRVDPEVDPSFFEWARANPATAFTSLITNSGAFKPLELSRKVHLMHILNIASTLLVGFFNRNERSRELLETYKDEFPQKDALLQQLNRSAQFISELDLPSDSYWLSKTNLFTIIVAVARTIQSGGEPNAGEFRQRLDKLFATLPEDYALAARQSVNNTREREARNAYIYALLQ
jgi:hypothetical protein